MWSTRADPSAAKLPVPSEASPASGLIVNGFAPLELSRLCACKKLSGDAAIYQRRRENRRY
jgi:hypothetical protein